MSLLCGSSKDRMVTLVSVCQVNFSEDGVSLPVDEHAVNEARNAKESGEQGPCVVCTVYDCEKYLCSSVLGQAVFPIKNLLLTGSDPRDHARRKTCLGRSIGTNQFQGDLVDSKGMVVLGQNHEPTTVSATIWPSFQTKNAGTPVIPTLEESLAILLPVGTWHSHENPKSEHMRSCRSSSQSPSRWGSKGTQPGDEQKGNEFEANLRRSFQPLMNMIQKSEGEAGRGFVDTQVIIASASKLPCGSISCLWGVEFGSTGAGPSPLLTLTRRPSTITAGASASKRLSTRWPLRSSSPSSSSSTSCSSRSSTSSTPTLCHRGCRSCSLRLKVS